MTKLRETPKDTNESSVQFMLTEFGRIKDSESYNRSSGETRVNLYITLVSFISGCLIVLRELTNPQDAFALRSFFFVGLLASIFMLLIGAVSFQLLLERWRLSVIYLRKLARIRKWFVSQDVTLQDSLVYSANDKLPSFVSTKFLSSSLTTLVSLLNSIVVAATVIFLVGVLYPYMEFWLVALVGVTSITIAWVLQMKVALGKLSRLEQDEYAAFPLTEITTQEDQ